VVRYDLDPAMVSRLVAAALAAHPSGGRFAALAVGADDPLADVARTMMARDADPDAYRDHESASLFLLVMDRKTGRPAGAGRAIDGGGRMLDDAPERTGRELSAIVAAHDLHDGKIWDLAAFAVLPGYRGRSGRAVRSLLCRTFLQAGRRAGVRHLVALLDQCAQRKMALLGVRFVPVAESGPFEYRGSASTRALYVPFADLEPSIAEQGDRLRRPGAEFAGEIRARGLCRLMTRRHAARVAEQVATGAGLDEHILLPGLDRRRLAHRR
jgi:hypothetical protein